MRRSAPSLIWLLPLVMVAGCGVSAAPTKAPSKAIGTTAEKLTISTPIDVQTSQDAVTSSEAAQPPEATKPAPAKAKRKEIYSETPGEELIAKAVRQAQRDHKRVLIEWGFNACGWCHLLHATFTSDPVVRPIVHEEFVLVLVDCNNQKLLKQYGGEDRNFSYPHLTVLDEQGNVLTNQNTEPLEKDKSHDPQAVAKFLNDWAPEKLDAETVIAKALGKAAEENKRVIVRVGTPYCGWCNILAQFMQDHQELFAEDYVDVKIDTMRMNHGEQVAARFHPKDADGVPWVVILDDSGKALATSVGPSGNIGYPYENPEIDHFIEMIRSTRQRVSDSQIDQIRNDLIAFRTERESRNQQ